MKKGLEKNVGLIIYLVVWAALFCGFWLGNHWIAGSEELYSLGAFYVLLPASSLVVGAMYGAGDSRIRFIIPVLLGALEALLEFLTFGMAHVLSNGRWSVWNGPKWTLCLFSLAPGLLGLLAGTMAKRSRRKGK